MLVLRAVLCHPYAVASGGNDCNVLVWSLEDQITSLLSGSSGGSAGAKEAPRLACE
jgi:hypothetical protein